MEVQDELALGQAVAGVTHQLPGALVPDDDLATTLLALGNGALEAVAVDWWSSTWMAICLRAGLKEGPLGTAHDTITPSSSRRTS